MVSSGWYLEGKIYIIANNQCENLPTFMFAFLSVCSTCRFLRCRMLLVMKRPGNYQVITVRELKDLWDSCIWKIRKLVFCVFCHWVWWKRLFKEHLVVSVTQHCSIVVLCSLARVLVKRALFWDHHTYYLLRNDMQTSRVKILRRM